MLHPPQKDNLRSYHKTEMVQVKKLRRTYCGGCNMHKQHRVSQYKKGRESKFCQGIIDIHIINK